MNKNQEGLEDILYWFGDTYLAISGSADDVDLIAKEHEQLIYAAEKKLRLAGYVKLSDVELDIPKIIEAMKTVPHALELESTLAGKTNVIDWNWEYANLAHAIAQAKEIMKVKESL